MTDLEQMLADEFARVADGAARWGDPVARVRNAVRRQQQRQFAVLAATGVMTGAAGIVALPRVGGSDGDPHLSATATPSATTAPEPTASAEPTASPEPSIRPPSPSASASATKHPTRSPSVRPTIPSQSPSPTPSPYPAPYGPGMVIGREYGYDLYTHCGIEFARFDGREWRTERLDDGANNPPPGWGNPQQSGKVVLLERNLAEFRGDNGETLTFEPTTEQPGTCM